MRVIIIGVIFAGTTAIAAWAQDVVRSWSFDRENGARLQLSGPGQEELVFAVTCAGRRMRIAHIAASERLKGRRTARLRLESAGSALDYIGAVETTGMPDVFSVEVSITPDPKLLALLGAGAEIAVEVVGSRETLPPAEVDQVKDLERGCISRR